MSPASMPAIGHTILRLDEVGSTNTLVMETPAYLENHGLVVLARHQTAGRGRIGRKWVSLPDAQLQFSVVLHPPLPREELPVVSLLAGLAVAEALEAALGLAPVLKWPNDVLLEGRKVCGILMELKQGAQGGLRLVVGIGLNCLGGEEGFPPELRDRLTTIEQAAGRPVDKEAVLQAVLAALQAWYDRLTAGGRPALLDAWERRSDMIGKTLRYPTPAGPREGRAAGLTEEGYLLIETAEGGRHIHAAGEVEWLG